MANDAERTAAALTQLMELQRQLFSTGISGTAGGTAGNLATVGVQHVWMLQVQPTILVAPRSVGGDDTTVTTNTAANWNAGKPGSQERENQERENQERENQEKEN
jgi:hypothetical protein